MMPFPLVPQRREILEIGALVERLALGVDRYCALIDAAYARIFPRNF